MRDLIGYIAFVLTAGQRCADAEPDSRDYADSAFGAPDGVGPDVARLDPCRLPDPRADEFLWQQQLSTRQTNGQNTSPELLLPRFRREKRRRFLENVNGKGDAGRLDPDAVAFASLLRQVELGDTEAGKADVIAAINRFFDPTSNDPERLRVWSTLRYDPRHQETIISNAALPADRFTLASPRPAPHMRCIPYTPDHLLLRINGTITGLRIDLSLFHVLRKVEQGLPPTLVPERYAYTLYQFMNRLARVTPRGNRFLVRAPEADNAFAITVTGAGQYID